LAEFKEYSPVKRPIINYKNLPDPSWIAGFVSREGNFDVRITLSTNKIKSRIQFIITQHEINIKLMNNIIRSLTESGNIYKYPKVSVVSINIIKFSDITNIIIPFFNKYSAKGCSKAASFKGGWCKIIWLSAFSRCKIYNLINDGLHLTFEGLNIIRNIKSGMNKGRNFTVRAPFWGPLKMINCMINLSKLHTQRFFSYLSLFTFFMLLLISADNFLFLFIGWEGKTIIELFALNNLEFINLYNYIFFFYREIKKKYIILNNILKKHFSIPKLRSYKRIGPHDEKTINIFIASLLGDGHLSKETLGSRFQFEQCNNNIEYLMWFHKYFSIRGYCNSKTPKLLKRIHKNGNIHYSYQFKTYTFSSFNWIHDMFYDKNNIKILPKNIEIYLTPFILAIWFMEDGCSLGKFSARLKISSLSFTLKENLTLCNLLNKKYGLDLKVQSRGLNKGYVIIINTFSAKLWSNLIKPYMLESMYYKLGKYR